MRGKLRLLALGAGLVGLLGSTVAGAAEDATGQSISGVVTVADGSSTEVCVIVIGPDDPDSGSVYGTACSPEAISDRFVYEISGLPPADYRVWFTAADPAVPWKWWHDKPSHDTADVITLEPGLDATGIDVTLGAGRTIAGTVIGEGGESVAGVCVTASLVPGSEWDELVTQVCVPSGTGSTFDYALQGFAPGEYHVAFVAPPDSNLRGEWYADRDGPQSADVIDLTSGDALGIDAELSRLEPDDEAPSLRDLAVAPSVVDATGGPGEVVVSLGVTDVGTGFYEGWVRVCSANGVHCRTRGFDDLQRTGGWAWDGAYEVPIEIPEHSASGEWRVETIWLYDAKRNQRQYDADELAGWEATFAVTSEEDVTPPILTGFLDPHVVDVSDGPALAAVSLEITDDVAGFGGGTVVACRPGQPVCGPRGDILRLDGDEFDGEYVAILEFPADSETGVWQVGFVSLTDQVGNTRQFRYPDLVEAGFDAEFRVIHRATPPRNVTAVRGNRSAMVTWEPPEDDGASSISSYTVTASPGEIGVTVSADVRSVEFGGLTNGVTYEFVVVATNEAGPSAPSQPSNLVTPATFPSAPASLDAVPGAGEITLRWQPPADDGGTAVTGYRIYQDGALTAEVDGMTREWTDVGLGEGETRAYRIAAVNDVGEGPQTPVVEATTFTRPGVPVQAHAQSGVGQVTVSWQPPADDGGTVITGYRIYRDGELAAEVGSDVHTWVDAPLTEGETHTYQVAAVNAVGEGPASARMEAGAFAHPSAPEAIAAEPGTDIGEIVVTWDAPTNDGGTPVTTYRVYRDGEVAGEVDADTSSFSDTGLTPLTDYTYTVTAVNAVGESPASASACAMPFPWVNTDGIPECVDAPPYTAASASLALTGRLAGLVG